MRAETVLDEGGTIVVYGPGVIVGTRMTKSLTIAGDGQTIITAGFGFNLAAGKRVVVSDVKVVDGFVFLLGAGKAILRNVTVDNVGSTVNAIDLQGSAGARLTLENVSVTNSTNGVFVSGLGGSATSVFLDGCKLNQASGSGLYVEGPSTAVLIDTVISGSGQADLRLVGGARAISYGNNVIRTGSPTQTLPEN